MVPFDGGESTASWDRMVWTICRRVPWLRRRETARRLRRLRCGVRLAYVTRLVRDDAPLVRRHARSRLVEYVYVLADAYVQVAVVPDSTVVWFAVTTRSSRFHPRLNYCPPTLPDIELGRTTFGELDVPRKGVVAFLGPFTFGHAESFYPGDAGSFQTYVFAHHAAGRSEEPPDFPTYFDGAGQPALGWFGVSEHSATDAGPLDDPAMTELRADETVNTYGVFGAYRPDESIDGYWWRVPFSTIAERDQVGGAWA
jgi:hypothetical protein